MKRESKNRIGLVVPKIVQNWLHFRIKKLLPKSEYTRNVLTLVTGTAIAQAIPIAVSPLLARIFSPEEFGVFALYLSITSVFAAVSTGRYEFAITLPVDDKEAVQLLWLSLLLTFFTSIITLIIIWIYIDEIVSLLGNPDIRPWLYVVPVTVFFSGSYRSYYYWFNRQKQFGDLSASRVSQTLSTSVVNLGLGTASSGGALGLVIGNVVGQFLSATYFSWRFFREPPLGNLKPVKSEMDLLVSRYRDFPKYDVPAAFFNISSNQAAYLLFNSFFSSAVSGYYYFGQKILNTPIMLIGNAIQDVFKMEVIEVHNSNGDTRATYTRTFRKLFVLAILPTTIMFFCVVEAFAFVFSEEWRTAGVYIQILIPAFFLRFICVPLSYMIYVAEKQYINTIGQCLLLLGIIAAFFIGQRFDAITTVQLLSLVFSLFYASYLYISYSLTSRGQLNS